MNKYEYAFRLMVEHDCYPDVWGGKAFVEGWDAEVQVADDKLEAVRKAILIAAEEKMQRSIA